MNNIYIYIYLCVCVCVCVCCAFGGLGDKLYKMHGKCIKIEKTLILNQKFTNKLHI